MELKYSTKNIIINELNEQYSFEQLSIMKGLLTDLWHEERYNSGRGDTFASEALWRLQDLFCQAMYDKRTQAYKEWKNPPTPEVEESPAPEGWNVVND